MSDKLIPLNKLDISDLLRLDARYNHLRDADLKSMASRHHSGLSRLLSFFSNKSPKSLRNALVQGRSFYRTDVPTLPLVVFRDGSYYINPDARLLVGNTAIDALKSRFPQLKENNNSQQPSGGLLVSDIHIDIYTPDPTTANTTPIEETVKNWLTIRFYRLDTGGKKEYLEGVPYSITKKYQPHDKDIFEQGKSPVGGTLEYDDMPSDDSYTVHYGLPGGNKYTDKVLVCPRKEHDLEVEEIKVTAKIDVEYKVVLLDKKLSSHQESTEEKVVTDGTAVELWLEQDPGSPVFDQGAKIEISGAGTIDAFLDKEMKNKLDIGIDCGCHST